MFAICDKPSYYYSQVYFIYFIWKQVMTDIPDPEITPNSKAMSLRKMPNQNRSRERVENILKCASHLIEKSGSDTMRMSDLAKMAGVSIGSLYQYFPDKAAIIQTLANRYTQEGQTCIKNALAQVTKPDQLLLAFEALIDEYYEIFLADPVMRDVWSGMQTDVVLRENDLIASRENAEFLADTLKRLDKITDQENLSAIAFMIIYLGEASMRIAIAVDKDEGQRLVNTYKRMALNELRRVTT